MWHEKQACAVHLQLDFQPVGLTITFLRSCWAIKALKPPLPLGNWASHGQGHYMLGGKPAIPDLWKLDSPSLCFSFSQACMWGEVSCSSWRSFYLTMTPGRRSKFLFTTSSSSCSVFCEVP